MPFLRRLRALRHCWGQKDLNQQASVVPGQYYRQLGSIVYFFNFFFLLFKHKNECGWSRLCITGITLTWWASTDSGEAGALPLPLTQEGGTWDVSPRFVRLGMPIQMHAEPLVPQMVVKDVWSGMTSTIVIFCFLLFPTTSWDFGSWFTTCRTWNNHCFWLSLHPLYPQIQSTHVVCSVKANHQMASSS